MSFYLKTENETPKTHGRHFSCRPENAYRGLQVENPGRRHYNPSIGRWASRDPIEEEGGLNLYVFSKDNPVCSFDPQGLCCDVQEFRRSFSRVVWGIEPGSWVTRRYHLLNLVGFTAKLKYGSNPKDCIIRQWMKGSVSVNFPGKSMNFPVWVLDGGPTGYWNGTAFGPGGYGESSVVPKIVLSASWVSTTRSFYFYDSPGVVAPKLWLPVTERMVFRTEVVEKATNVVQAFVTWGFSSFLTYNMAGSVSYGMITF